MNEWHKSSYSQGETSCVEVKEGSHSVLIRDTQNRELGHLSFNSPEWTNFLQEVKDGRL
ncbi:DUF397 domain-containing protein [Nocardiopsis sp. N85]|uniref:DUF397 domain-containing protein n=1 Tax=Nocardiopsis sp. N85 TaxID=3029400 RepID=UPI000A01CD2D|nr:MULTISPECIES: DUF397 domain-containing protein [Nocardiopsis]MDE3722484.1 DUF397 domain-containing protein [Nocardiopsis sp. N85]